MLVFVIVSVVSLRWTLSNPHIAGWDQIQYVELVLKDALIRKLEGAGALRDALFNDYRWMPPGIRFLAMPRVIGNRVTETDFRLFSLILFGLSLVVLFDAARRISNRAIAAGAVALTAVAPVWVRASEDFMSETALIPAVVLVLWCLVRETEAERPRFTPLLMGAGLGFGMLARFSFAPMAAIVLAMLAYDAWRTRAWSRLLVTVLVATLVAWPSYAYNGVRYVAYGRFAATWPLDQLPGRGLAYGWNYIRRIADSVFGPPVLIVLPFAIAFVLRGLTRRRATVAAQHVAASLPARRFIGVGCGVVLLSMLLPHMLGHNQHPRYMLGALPVLSLFLAAGAGLRLAFVMGAVATLQALILLFLMVTGPYQAALNSALDRTDLMADSWRGNPVCDFSQAVRAVSPQAARPVVKFYGVTGVVNHVQIELAFIRAGILAHVIPADLAHPDQTDPTRSGADMVLVLNPPDGGDWSHRFVANPNTHLGAVRDALSHSPAYVRSDARIGGPPDKCTMDVFLARK